MPILQSIGKNIKAAGMVTLSIGVFVIYVDALVSAIFLELFFGLSGGLYGHFKLYSFVTEEKPSLDILLASFVSVSAACAIFSMFDPFIASYLAGGWIIGLLIVSLSYVLIKGGEWLENRPVRIQALNIECVDIAATDIIRAQEDMDTEVTHSQQMSNGSVQSPPSITSNRNSTFHNSNQGSNLPIAWKRTVLTDDMVYIEVTPF